MTRRSTEPGFDDDEIQSSDPLGEQLFAEAGFEDAPGGGPLFDAPGMSDENYDKRPGGAGQKMAGIPEHRQHETNTPSEDRPDSEGVVIRERGGEGKGDPSIGGTRPD